MDKILNALKQSSEISSSLALKLDSCEKTIKQLNNKIAKLESELETIKETSNKSVELRLNSNMPSETIIKETKIIKKPKLQIIPEKQIETSETLKDFIKNINAKTNTKKYDDSTEESDQTTDDDTEDFSMLKEITEVPVNNNLVRNHKNMGPKEYKALQNIGQPRKIVNRKFK